MAIVNQHINDFLDYYLNLNEPQYAVLLSGKWGSGKTHFIRTFKNDHANINLIQISLFGLKSKEDIHRRIVLKQLTFPKTSEVIGKGLSAVFAKMSDINLSLSDVSIELAIKQVGKKKTVFVFDDLERIETSFSEVFGYINQLVEEYGQKVIFIADESKLVDQSEYQQFKEKIIGKIFQIEQDFDTAFATFLSELKNSKEILQGNQYTIKSVYETAGFHNLRSLKQGLLDFDRMINSFEDKFKNHPELMTGISQIFFAFTFEIKSSSFDIKLLHRIIELKTGKLQEEERNNVLNEIKYISKKYNFLFEELFLSNQNWIDFFTKGILSATEISAALNQSRYFLKEQREEWVKLWHYMWLEEEEFQDALKKTREKIAANEYVKPAVVLHIAGILLSLSIREMIVDSKAKIIDDLKKYVDLNTKNWDDLEKVDHHELSWNHLGLGYMSEDTEEFRLIRDYLVNKAEEVRREGLKEKGDLLITYLNENKIYEFADMLTAERNKEILYRLPVFNFIEPKVFFNALLQVENKYMRDVFDVLKNRYRSINAYEKETVLEELDFWKATLKIIKNHKMEISYKIKDVWIKTYFHAIVEKDIIQTIEREIERNDKTKQVEEGKHK